MNTQDLFFRQHSHQAVDDMWLYIEPDAQGDLHASTDAPMDILMNPFTAAGFVTLMGQYNDSDHGMTLPEFLAAR